MPVSSATRSRIRKFLDPDEEIVYVFPADVLMSTDPSVIFVVTQRAIKILSTGMWSRKSPKSVVAELPRNTRIGPVEPQQIPYFNLSGLTYEIDEEYVAVVNAADSELTREGNGPSDPLPDL